MHGAVMEYVRRAAERFPEHFDAGQPGCPVIEFGAQDMNGSARDVVRGGQEPGAAYIGIDPICTPGTRGVQVQCCAHEVRLLRMDVGALLPSPISEPWQVSAAAPYMPIQVLPGAPDVAESALHRVRLVISTEVLEHDPHWIATVCNAVHHLQDRGLFVFTVATDRREPHGLDSCTPEPGYYRNLSPGEIRYALSIAGVLSGCRLEVLDLRVVRNRMDLYGVVRVHRPAEPLPRPRLLLGRDASSLSAFLSCRPGSPSTP